MHCEVGMAGKRIQGITIEIGGNTTKLQSALKGVDDQLGKTQSSLNDVNRLLKLDPSNTELLAQKQKLLKNAVKETGERLKVLKEASEKTAKTAENYDEWKAAYDSLQKEIEETREKLKNLKKSQEDMKESGEIDSESYVQLQEEIKQTNSKLKDLRKNQQRITEEFGEPISPEKFDSLQREIVATEIKLNGMESELKTLDDVNSLGNLESDLNDIEREADSAGAGLRTMGDATTVSALADLTDILGDVSEKVQEVGENATEAYLEIEGATTKVAAYFGETEEVAKESGQTIKEIYESGVGESLDLVADAVINVKKQLGNLKPDELKTITKQAIVLEETFDVDMTETLRGINALMIHFGMDAQTAMDYIVAGTQNGLDKTNELGDNLAEYSGKFKEAGYSAEEYFQLLNNGLDGGAYNLDKVNDAINEVTTRLGDGTITESIKEYSKETRSLFKEWKNGDASQKEVIESIIKDINAAEGQQKQWNLATTAFGTIAEDGGMKMIGSLTTIGDMYTDVSGKAQKMNEDTSTSSQKTEASLRKLKNSLSPLGEKMTEIKNIGLTPLADGMEKLSEIFKNMPDSIQTLITSFGIAITAVTAALPVITAVKAILAGIKMLGIGASIASLASPIGIAIAAITAIITVGTLLYKNWDTVKEKAGELKEKVSEKWSALKEKTSNTWSDIKSDTSEKWSKIKFDAKESAENIKEKVSDKWSKIKEKTSNTWSGVKSTIKDKMESAKETVHDAIEKIKEKFNFTWKLPDLKLPHISITGGFSLKPLSVPKFSVEWYEKAMDQVHILNGASIFGTMNGRMLGGGEAGSEMVVGKSYMMNLIQQATSQSYMSLANSIDSMAMKMINMMASYFPKFANLKLVMDTGEVVGVLAPRVDEELGRIADREDRGR